MKKSTVQIPVITLPKRTLDHLPGEVDNPRRLVPHYIGGPSNEKQDLCVTFKGFDADVWSNTARHKTEWLESPVWEGTLTPIEYRCGRSSSCYAVRIETCVQYSASTAPRGTFDPSLVGTLLSDGQPPVEGYMSCMMFFDLLPLLKGGSVHGKFTARKQGNNYMIIPA